MLCLIALIAGGVIFLAGIILGAWLASLYPRRDDKEFKEYLRREYGSKTKQ